MNWILWIFLAFLVLSFISAAITAYRYRQYIQSAWFMFKTYRQIKQKTKPQTKQKNIETSTKSSDSPLVRCSKCQKWIPQDSAVKLKSNFFCSHSCMEKSFAVKS
jgi:formylmethanofuran dehydrogenase subunit E